jgi:hypothetical protein
MPKEQIGFVPQEPPQTPAGGPLAESPRGISPRGAHRTVRDRLRSHGSCHPLKTTASHQDHRVPPVSR